MTINYQLKLIKETSNKQVIKDNLKNILAEIISNPKLLVTI